MKTPIISFALLLLFSSIGFSQFSQEVVATNHLVMDGKILDAGDQDKVFLNSNDLYHMKYNGVDNFDIRPIENSVSDLDFINLIDFDRDGDLDIIANRYKKGRLYTFEKVDGEYLFRPDVRIFNSTPASVYVQDYNDDGHGDIFYGRSLFLSKGPNEFELALTATGPSNTYFYKYMRFVDIDGDGVKEIIGQIQRNLWLFKDIGEGKMSRQLISEFSNQVDWFDVLDIDGEPVVIFQHVPSNTLRRIGFENDSISSKVVFNGIVVYDQTSVEVNDIDKDGQEEFLTSSFTNLKAHLYDQEMDTLIEVKRVQADGSSGMTTIEVDSQTFVVTNNERGFQSFTFQVGNWQDHNEVILGIGLGDLLDIDGDQHTDIVEKLPFQRGYLVKRYIGNGQFAPVENVKFDDNFGDFQDYDSDGDLDFLLSDGWHENLGELAFSDFQSRPPDTLTYPEPNILFTKLALEDDLDGDGDIDLITYNNFGENIGLRQNVDNQYFETETVIGTSEDISGDLLSIQAIDLDVDGDRDILMVAATGAVWFEQEATLKFATAVKINETDFRPATIDVADMNNDGYPDIVIGTFRILAGSVSGHVQLSLGSESGPTSIQYVSEGEGVHRAAFAEVTGDDQIEIIHLRTNALFWSELKENNSFETRFIDGDFGINNKLLVQDADGDGDQDIITFCESCFAHVPNQDNRISYYLNREDFGFGEGCPMGSVYLETQAEVDIFRSNFGGCKVINGDLRIGELIDDWSDISNFQGIQNIEEVKGNVTLWYNNANNNFAGFEKLNKIGGTLFIDGFKKSQMTGFDNLKTVGGDFRMRNIFTGGSSTGDLSTFDSLQSIGGDIEIWQSRVTKVDWPSFQKDTFQGNITFSWIASDGLELPFLKSLEHVNGRVEISDTQIKGLSDLSNLKTISDEFILVNNLCINSLILLDSNLVFGNSFDIRSNSNLQVCSVPAICNHINSGKDYRLINNSLDCHESTIPCGTVSTKNATAFERNVNIFPQPASRNLMIDMSSTDFSTHSIRYNMIDIRGAIQLKGIVSGQTEINVSHLVPGMYLLRFYDHQNILGIRKVVIAR